MNKNLVKKLYSLNACLIAQGDELHEKYRAYKQFEMNDKMADHFIMESVRQGALQKTKIDLVYAEWKDPKYEEFKPRTGWSLFNAHTEINKRLNYKVQIQRAQKLHKAFDLIICNHVLEHIDNDLLAIKELYRVLKKGGCGIFQVPINENSEKTFQNNKITDFKKRTEVFGQYDHLRVYGKDYYSLLRSVGFKVNAVDYLKKIDPKLSILYCLPKNEKIPIVYKN